MSDGGRCVKHDNWHAHCQQCCREEAADLRAQRDALAEALRNTMRAAEGFMAAVRADTKTAYPWEPWEHEAPKARAAGTSASEASLTDAATQT